MDDRPALHGPRMPIENPDTTSKLARIKRRGDRATRSVETSVRSAWLAAAPCFEVAVEASHRFACSVHKMRFARAAPHMPCRLPGSGRRLALRTGFVTANYI